MEKDRFLGFCYVKETFDLNSVFSVLKYRDSCYQMLYLLFWIFDLGFLVLVLLKMYA